jgi:outer membrane murein-binding lipoprotein Lpp
MTFLVRMTVKWTRVEDQMKEMVGKVADLVEDKDKIHHAIYDAIKEDRRANNERLTYLERSVWPVSERRDFPKSRE